MEGKLHATTTDSDLNKPEEQLTSVASPNKFLIGPEFFSVGDPHLGSASKALRHRTMQLPLEIGRVSS